MAELKIFEGAESAGTVYPLTKQRTLLGRQPDCDIVLSLQSVSRSHAQIVRIGERFHVEDLGSRNGVLVNRERIEGRRGLKNGDSILIGEALLLFKQTEDIITTLVADLGDPEQPNLEVLPAVKSTIEKECRRIRQALQTRHVFYDNADITGVHQELVAAGSSPQTLAKQILAKYQKRPIKKVAAVTDSPARKIMGEGFHRLVVLDAAKGIAQETAQFDLQRFFSYAYDQLVQAFELPLSGTLYHPENIAQILKEVPRSLFCFVNLQHIPVADLRRLRSFTQQTHQVLFACCGPRNVSREESNDDAGWESKVDLVVDPVKPKQVLQTKPNKGANARPKKGAKVKPRKVAQTLLEISKSLSRTLELDSLFPKITDNLFQLFPQADRCFLIVVEEGTDQLVLRATRTRRPSQEPAARFSRSVVSACLEAVQAVLSDDASSDSRFASDPTIAEFRIRSVMCAPLCSAAGKPVGAIQLDTTDRAKNFTQDDLKLLLGVASQIALALENAQLHSALLVQEWHQRDLELAREVQRGFLPQRMPVVPGYQFAAHYESALGVGGDYYNFIPLPGGRWGVLVGDVSAKGMAGALLMAKTSGEARFCLLAEADPAAALTRLNDQLLQDGMMDRFLLLVAAVLDPEKHTVTLANGGQVPPLLYHADGRPVEDAMPSEKSGLPLGVMEHYAYESCQVQLQPGDSLLLYTDGITDALNVQNGAFGLNGLHAAVNPTALAPPAVVESITAAVRRHTEGRPRHDDITLVSFGRIA